MVRINGAKRPSGSLRRAHLVAVCLAAAIAACGGDELSLTKYVEEINDAAAEAGERAEQLTAEGALGGGGVTPREVEAGIGRGLEELRIPLQEAVDAIEPPGQVAEMHALLWGWHAELIRVETALAERVGAAPHTEAGWTELSDSPEMIAYRASVAEGKQLCLDFQTRLDETEERRAFEDVPWMPSELSEVVSAALGCEWFPDDPQSIYRYPPP